MLLLIIGLIAMILFLIIFGINDFFIQVIVIFSLLILTFILLYLIKNRNCKKIIKLKDNTKTRRFELLDVYVLFYSHNDYLFLIKDVETEEIFAFFKAEYSTNKYSLINCSISELLNYQMVKTSNSKVEVVNYHDSKMFINFHDKGNFWIDEKKNNHLIKKNNKYYFKELFRFGYKVGYKYIKYEGKISKGEMFNLNKDEYDISVLKTATLTNGIIEFDL